VTITPIPGEPGRYHVQATSLSGQYIVDLADWDFLGSCNCHDHAIRIAPFLSRGETPERTECKHLKAVKDQYLSECLKCPATRKNLVSAFLRADLETRNAT